MLSVEDAERELVNYHRVVTDRDNRVRRALAAGISKNRIHALTGIARTTLDRILKEPAMPDIRIIDVEEPDDLYHASGGGDLPQIHPTYIKLDLDQGALRASVAGYADNPTLGREQAGFTRSWEIPLLTAEAANRIMREIRPLAQRMIDDWTTEPRDFANGGVAARLGPDAAAADAEITDRLSEAFDESDIIEVRCDDVDDFDEWGLTGATTDAELDEIERRVCADLGTPGRVTVWYMLGEQLASRRDELAERDA